MRSTIFDQLKKGPTPVKRSRYRFIVTGNDLPSLLTFDSLREKFGDDNVRLLNSLPTSLEEWKTQAQGLLRGEGNLKLLQELRPSLDLKKDEFCTSKFLKDHSFRPFNGRFRPLKLVSGEEYFTLDKYLIPQEQLLTPGQEGRIRSALRSGMELIGNITKIGPETGENHGGGWEVQCSDDNLYECEHLFFGQDPQAFSRFLWPKESFSNKMLQLCSDYSPRPCVTLNFSSNKEIGPQTGTLFIPQSQTYDWGHFIGEFSPFDPEKGTQSFSFFFIVPEEENTPADISKKIHLLKRLLAKVFPAILTAEITESIFTTLMLPCSVPNDSLYDNVKTELKNFTFLGMGSPLSKDFIRAKNLPDERVSYSHLGRALASSDQALIPFL